MFRLIVAVNAPLQKRTSVRPCHQAAHAVGAQNAAAAELGQPPGGPDDDHRLLLANGFLLVRGPGSYCLPCQRISFKEGGGKREEGRGRREKGGGRREEGGGRTCDVFVKNI